MAHPRERMRADADANGQGVLEVEVVENSANDPCQVIHVERVGDAVLGRACMGPRQESKAKRVLEEVSQRGHLERDGHESPRVNITVGRVVAREVHMVQAQVPIDWVVRPGAHGHRLKSAHVVDADVVHGDAASSKQGPSADEYTLAPVTGTVAQAETGGGEETRSAVQTGTRRGGTSVEGEHCG